MSPLPPTSIHTFLRERRRRAIIITALTTLVKMTTKVRMSVIRHQEEEEKEKYQYRRGGEGEIRDKLTETKMDRPRFSLYHLRHWLQWRWQAMANNSQSWRGRQAFFGGGNKQEGATITDVSPRSTVVKGGGSVVNEGQNNMKDWRTTTLLLSCVPTSYLSV